MLTYVQLQQAGRMGYAAGKATGVVCAEQITTPGQAMDCATGSILDPEQWWQTYGVDWSPLDGTWSDQPTPWDVARACGIDPAADDDETDQDVQRLADAYETAWTSGHRVAVLARARTMVETTVRAGA